MESLLLATIFISFFSTYLVMPFWIKKASQIGLLWEDMHKKGHPKNVAGSGGIIVLWGFSAGVLIYIALNILIFKGNYNLLTQIFALLTVLFLSSLIGFMDDLFGWRKGGLSNRSRLILILFASIPLIVINAGNSIVNLPFLGIINLGILYPLLVIPIGIVGATTTYNFLAGYNGLESGQGIIILSALAFVTYLTGNEWLTIISLCMVAALIGFHLFNRYPAKVFPGDVLTYLIGAMIASVAILGNIERIAILFFIPYIIETILKLRGRLKKYSFGKLNSDGSLDQPFEKIYGLEHLSIKILKKIKPSKKVYEKDVVYLIHLFQILVIGLVLILSF
ncbi:glycosyl transferase family 4 [Candidatus Pacearchaeota archaeon]|nr:glycosyl transferase family 4 [Candidatus Pacearchaeota archaeon]